MKQIPCPDCDGRGFHMRFENNNGACRAWNELCDTCCGKGYIEAITTNADRIRRMSDEELAKMLNDGCPPGRSYIRCGRDNCIDCWLGWLRQPAEEDT